MRGGSQLVDRFSSRRLGEGRPSRSAGRAVGEAAGAQPLCACCKVVAAAIDACADAGGGATAVTAAAAAAAAAASLSAGSVDADATDAEAAPELSPSTKSGALAIQTGQPSSVGAVRLRFELKLGLGGWNCGLKTLGCGCEGVDSVNEGVRSAAFDEGVRLAGRLRLGDVACSAASSDSLAAWGCVSLAGVSIAPAALAFAQLQKLFLAPGEITWGPDLRSDFTCDAASRTKRARVEPGSRACASLRMPPSQ